MARPAINLEELGVDERLDLIEEIWDSLIAVPGQIPVPESHKVELDRRLDKVESGDDSGIPWEEVLDRIRTGLK